MIVNVEQLKCELQDLIDNFESNEIDLKDKLYDLTAQAENAASSASYLRRTDAEDLTRSIDDLESELDSLAQELRDLHSEL